MVERIIDAGREFRNDADTVADGLFTGRGSRAARMTQFWVLLVLASTIAAGGVVGNATPAVIGAMIIAPLATPIYGVALATVMGSRRDLRDALLLLLAGIVVNILIGMLVAFVTFDRMPLDANPQITGRTAPTVLDLMVAITVGVAGSFALVRRDVSAIVAGVAIAISLVPVLAVVGITLGSGRYDLALGALLLFATNAAAIIVAGVVVFSAAGYAGAVEGRRPQGRRRAKVVIAVLLVVLLIPLAALSARTYFYQVWMNGAHAAAETWVAGSSWRVEDVRQLGGSIVVTVLGSGDSLPLEEFRTAVRRVVPATVPITLIEGSGRSIQL